MSTRCQIKLLGDYMDFYIYRHCDGYPGSIVDNEIGVIPDIMPLCITFMEKRCYEPDYLAACLVSYLKQWHCGKKLDTDNYVMEVNGITIPYLGHGIDTTIHKDIQYLYEIDSIGITIMGKFDQISKSQMILCEKHLFSDYEIVNGVCKLK